MIHSEEARRLEHQTARGSRIVVYNAALLIETGSHTKYHRVVVVFCETAEQLDRIVSRDKLSEDDARARIASQMPTEEKIREAHYTIDTTPGFGATESRSRAVYRHLQFDLEALSRV